MVDFEIDIYELKMAIQEAIICNKQREDDLIAIAEILGFDLKQFELKEN